MVERVFKKSILHKCSPPVKKSGALTGPNPICLCICLQTLRRPAAQSSTAASHEEALNTHRYHRPLLAVPPLDTTGHQPLPRSSRGHTTQQRNRRALRTDGKQLNSMKPTTVPSEAPTSPYKPSQRPGQFFPRCTVFTSPLQPCSTPHTPPHTLSSFGSRH